MRIHRYSVIVVGGGHAGAEAAWAAANLLPAERHGPGAIGLVTLDPTRIGVMSCNPAIGGLAKGQIVREVDAMGGLMGLAADASGIQFKVLNTSKGPAVHGPRAQCDRHVYAETVRAMLASRPEIEIVAGSVERLLVEPSGWSGSDRRIVGVEIRPSGEEVGEGLRLESDAVVLTTGTFMRGLMHTGERRTAGGRHGEGASVGLSAALEELGFELGRLKTGTPPRLKRSSIDWDALTPALGDDAPVPFSELTGAAPVEGIPGESVPTTVRTLATRFPLLEQIDCRQTRSTPEAHALIRDNLHRAPMYSGQIDSAGPRYCPSIEDKVVRFEQRESHGVFLEPESLRDDFVYCNGISTSLPEDVQDRIVRSMPGCERAHIYRYGYAVEYDMVRPHQIHATGMTKLIDGLYLAGQINGTSGYEEAAAQGLVAGINAARLALGRGEFVLGRADAYIGVLMDDLVCRTPVEPYRMFTSRAEHRLILRADNAADRLTPIAMELGLLEATPLGRVRASLFERRRGQIARVNAAIDAARRDGVPLSRAMRRPDFTLEDLQRETGLAEVAPAVWRTVFAERRYEAYIDRQRAEIRRQAELEGRRLPAGVDYHALEGLRSEAQHALSRFRPTTYGQAARLEGVTPADLTLLSVLLRRGRRDGGRIHTAAQTG